MTLFRLSLLMMGVVLHLLCKCSLPWTLAYVTLAYVFLLPTLFLELKPMPHHPRPSSSQEKGGSYCYCCYC